MKTDLKNIYEKKDDVDVVVKQEQLCKLKTEVLINHSLFQQFNEYLMLKYSNHHKEISKNKNLEIDFVFNEGLLQARKSLNNETLILFRDKSPRKDVLQKLGNIAFELRSSDMYPQITPGILKRSINKVLANNDSRTINAYKKCILQYCDKINHFGILDATMFIERIPKTLIKEKNSFD